MKKTDVEAVERDYQTLLLGDLSELAKADGIQISFQPALHTRTNASVILRKFGIYEKVSDPKNTKKGLLNDYYISVHYKLKLSRKRKICEIAETVSYCRSRICLRRSRNPVSAIMKRSR